MKNLQFRYIYFLLLILLSGCQLRTNTISPSIESGRSETPLPNGETKSTTIGKTALPTRNLSLISDLPNTEVVFIETDELSIYDYGVPSPDGNWIIQNHNPTKENEFNTLSIFDNSNWPLLVIPVDNPADRFELDINAEEGSFYQIFFGWSPDNKSFLTIGSDSGEGGPGLTKFTLFSLNKNRQVIRTTTQERKIYSINWSTDSSKIIITEGGTEYSISSIDFNTNIITTLFHDERITPESKFIFGDTKIIAWYPKSDSMGNENELFRYDPDFSNPILIYPEGGLQEMDKVFLSPDEKYLLIEFCKVDTNCNLKVINVTDGHLIKVIDQKNYSLGTFYSSVDFSNAHNQSVSAMVAQKQYSDENKLLLFNWDTLKLGQAGTIQALFGWCEKFNGFLVKKDGKFQVVRLTPND